MTDPMPLIHDAMSELIMIQNTSITYGLSYRPTHHKQGHYYIIHVLCVIS
jgi:hypothetical protein